MQEEEEGKMKIGPRGPCDCVHDLLAEKKKKSTGPRVLHVVGVLVQPSVLSHSCLTTMEE